jgi:O-phospho-L-seryl-tRNASec:L-selenocysteinyl-tRNA synthase
MDVFITLLSLGVNGYKSLITQRKEMYTYLKEELTKVALKHGERLLETKNNPISLGNQ